MTILEVTLPVLKEVMRQNLEILKLLRTPKHWYDPILPAFYTLVGASVATFGQWLLFRLGKKKEFAKDMAKLYAEFGLHSKEYSDAFFDLNYTMVQGDVTMGIREHYKMLAARPQDKEAQWAYQSMISECDEIMGNLTSLIGERKKKFRELKYSAIKALMELSFQLNSSKLDKLIKEFEDVKMYQYTDADKVELEILKQKDHAEAITNDNVIPLKNKIDELIRSIQDEIKAIKK